jgi:hypothetical protein
MLLNTAELKVWANLSVMNSSKAAPFLAVTQSKHGKLASKTDYTLN